MSWPAGLMLPPTEGPTDSLEPRAAFSYMPIWANSSASVMRFLAISVLWLRAGLAALFKPLDAQLDLRRVRKQFLARHAAETLLKLRDALFQLIDLRFGCDAHTTPLFP